MEPYGQAPKNTPLTKRVIRALAVFAALAVAGGAIGTMIGMMKFGPINHDSAWGVGMYGELGAGAGVLLGLLVGVVVLFAD